MKLLLTIIFMVSLKGVSLCQSVNRNEPAELLRLLQKTRQDSTRLNILHQLGEYYFNKPKENKMAMDSAQYFFQEAVRFGNIAQQSDGAGFANRCWLGIAYIKQGNSQEGKKWFIPVTEHLDATGNKEREAQTLFNFGEIRKDFNENDNYAGVLTMFQRALSIYTLSGNKEKIIDVSVEIANIDFVLGQYDKAEKQLLSISEIIKSANSGRVCDYYYLFSAISRYMGNFNGSLLYATNCIRRLEETKNSSSAPLYYGELALVYDELGQYDSSIVWYHKALEKREQDKNPVAMIYRTAYLLSMALIKNKNEKEALSVIEDLIKRVPPEGPAVNEILSQTLANCYNSMKQYRLAEKYYLEMAKWFADEKIHGEEYYVANFDIGRFYVNQGQFQKAGHYLEQIVRNAAGITLSRIKDTHQLLFRVDSASGNYLSAMDHLKQYKILNDSIFNAAKSRQIEELEIQHETVKKEQNIQLLEKEKKIEQGKMTQVKYTRDWMLGGFALLLIIMSLLINYSRLKQRTNKKLKAQQTEISQQNGALHHLVNEKEWLLKEIHHRVKNNLHTIVGLLDTQSAFLKTEEALAALNDSQRRVQAMSMIHQKLYQSDNLSAVEMSGYIHELVDYLKHSFNTGQRILFKLQIEPLQLNLSSALPLGLILNEAITNSIKYAFPSSKDGIITISLKHPAEDLYLLTIADNGTGLPDNFDYRNSRSMGMNLMQGLSEDIHGIFSIKNNKGAEINISFSYDPYAGNDLNLHEPGQSTETT